MIDCVKRALPEQIKAEVIVSEGSAVSLQRNRAVEQASADIIYLLDDDSFVRDDALKVGLKIMGDQSITAVGGPALTDPQASLFEHTLGCVMSSFFGTFITNARNKPLGRCRRVAGDELTSCNLMMRKAAFEQVAGMDLSLYPGEDVDLIERLNQNGSILYYEPEMIIFRRRSSSIPQVMHQFFSYGQGRGLQLHQARRSKVVLFLLPSLFVLYLLIGPFTGSSMFAIPLLAYSALVLLNSFIAGTECRSAKVFLLSLLMFPTVHLSYGLGMVRGLLVSLAGGSKEMTSPVKIRVLNLAPDARAEEAQHPLPPKLGPGSLEC
jgi:hypothetical protein